MTDQVDGVVQALAASFKHDDLIAFLVEHGIPCAPVRSIEGVALDPELAQRECSKTVTTPVGILSKALAPLKLSEIADRRPVVTAPDAQSSPKKYLLQ